MDSIIQSIEHLLLGSIPTIVLFVVLVLAYQILVQGPLSKTLRERRARTVGAVEEAQKAIALAEAKASEYAEALRQARVQVYKQRDERLKQWQSERDAALNAARAAAHTKVVAAVSEIEAEAAIARQNVQSQTGELAALVVRAILPQAAGGIR